jgi:hypothetical protein
MSYHYQKSYVNTNDNLLVVPNAKTHLCTELFLFHIEENC